MSQTVGRHTSLTFVTRLKPFGSIWLRTLFWAARHFAWLTRPLVRLDFIHYARWTVLPDKRLLFESDFDGSLPEYIDTFADVVAWRMQAAWWLSYGYPKLIPTDVFFAWVNSLESTPVHFYSAYPDASTAMVGRALQVDSRLQPFVASASSSSMSDDEFAAAYEDLLVEVQQWL